MIKEFNEIDYSNLSINETSKRLHMLLQKWIPFADQEFAIWKGRKNCGHFFGGSYFYEIETAYPMFIYALLSKYGEYDESITAIKQTELEDKAIMCMRYLCYTHDIGPADCVREKSNNVYANGTKWGGKNDEFFRATSVGRTGTFLAITALLLKDKVDDDIMELIEKIVTNFANRWSDELPRAGTYFDTQSEENAWTALGIVGALVLYKKHPNREKWLEAFNRWNLNSISTSKDRMNTGLFLGKSLRNFWMKGVTFHPDFTNENHSFLHPSYVSAGILLKFESATLLKMTGNKLPESIFHNNEKVYDHALKRWVQHDGLLIPVQGQDWWYNKYHGEHLLHTVMGLFYDKKEATYYEKESITCMEKLQDSHSEGTLLEEKSDQKIDEYGHYNLKMMEHGCAITIAFSFMLHTYFGDRKTEISLTDINKAQKGVFEFPFGGSIVHRTINSFSCFNFRNKVMAFTLPKDEMWLITPIISSHTGEIHFKNREMVESLSNERDIRESIKKDINIKEDGFCGTCTVERDNEKIFQDISFVSLPNGMTVYTEAFTVNKTCEIKQFHTGLVGIRNENIKMLAEVAKGYVDVLSSDHTYRFKGYFGGEKDDVMNIEHNGYVNVDHKMGYIIYGGNKVTYINKHKYSSWKGVEDQLIFNHIDACTLKKGDYIKPLTLIALPNYNEKDTKKQFECAVKYETSIKKTYLYEIDDYLISCNFNATSQLIKATSNFKNIVNIYNGETTINNRAVTRTKELLMYHSDYEKAVGQIKITNDTHLAICMVNKTLIIENIDHKPVKFTFNDIEYIVEENSSIKISDC